MRRCDRCSRISGVKFHPAAKFLSAHRQNFSTSPVLFQRVTSFPSYRCRFFSTALQVLFHRITSPLPRQYRSFINTVYTFSSIAIQVFFYGPIGALSTQYTAPSPLHYNSSSIAFSSTSPIGGWLQKSSDVKKRALGNLHISAVRLSGFFGGDEMFLRKTSRCMLLYIAVTAYVTVLAKH